MSGTRAISTTSRRELLSSFFSLQGKAPKEIHAILTETLVFSLPGWAKDLSPPLYFHPFLHRVFSILSDPLLVISINSLIVVVFRHPDYMFLCNL